MTYRRSLEADYNQPDIWDLDQGDIGPRKTGDESKGSYRTDS
jgi:hypothetical protein